MKVILTVALFFILSNDLSSNRVSAISIIENKELKRHEVSKETLIEIIAEEAKNADIPPGLLISLCYQESSFRVHVSDVKLLSDSRQYISHGLCQIQQRTARDRGFDGSLQLLYKPNLNARYSGRQLSWCKSKFIYWTWALDCYRRGYSMVRKYKIRIKDYPRNGYVRSILNRYYLSYDYSTVNTG